MDFTIPEEYRELQRRTRSFVETDLRQCEREVEETDEIPSKLWRKLIKRSVDLGLYAPFGPEAYGVGGIESQLAELMLWEAMGATVFGFSERLVGNTTVSLSAANEYQKENFIIPMLRAEKIGPFAGMTEPGAGSDRAGYKTTAVRNGDSWVLNGTKCYITGGDLFDWGFVLAVVNEGKPELATFYVDVNTPGFEIGEKSGFMSLRGIHHVTINFKNCIVPEAAKGKIWEKVELVRMKRGATCLGGAQYCLDLCLNYVKERKTFSQPLATKQSIQWRLVESALELHAARLVLYHAAWKVDQGEDYAVESAMSKIAGVEAAERVSRKVIQCMGGPGLGNWLPVERVYRDATGAATISGSNDIMRLIIARNIIGELVKY